MNRRGMIHSLIASVVLGPVIACGGDDPPPPPAAPPAPPPVPEPPKPTVASLTLRAGQDVNPNVIGLPSPVVVRIYQLTSVTYFQETGFFALQEDASSALGDELISTEDFVLAPGGVAIYQRELVDDVRFLGVTAAFRDLSAGRWRSFHAVPAATTTLLEADIVGTEVTVRKAGL